MSRHHDNDRDAAIDFLDSIEADRFAGEMDDFMLDIADLDPETCPPNRRIFLGDREAWVYEHGNIVELVFVKLDEG